MKTAITAVLILIVMISGGCADENRGSAQRTRLVVNENIKLKKLLEQRDQQITEVQKQFLDCQAQAGSNKESSEKSTSFMTDMIMDLQMQVNELTKKNSELEARLAELEPNESATTP